MLPFVYSNSSKYNESRNLSISKIRKYSTMPNLQSQSYVFHRAFHDIDELTENARAWDLEFSQLDPGHFDGELTQIGNERINLSNARFNRHLFQKGVPPQGLRTFAIPADSAQQFLWRRKEVRGEQVLAFPNGGELDAVSWSGFQVFTLSFSEEILAEAAEGLELPTLQTLFAKGEVFIPHPESLHLVCNWLQEFFHDLVQDIPNGRTFFSQDAFEHELPVQLLKSLAFQEAYPRPSLLLRHKALKRVEDYLNAYPLTPHTVRELCRVAPVSERTLEYAFLERFGVSPKAYLHTFRLNGVRKALRIADPASESVTAWATRWGFWHMGQFAKDYKRLFAELPSETLKKRHARL
ncbi:MAG: helix-turn-helix domain-containing protein [Nitrospirales bacterium]